MTVINRTNTAQTSPTEHRSGSGRCPAQQARDTKQGSSLLRMRQSVARFRQDESGILEKPMIATLLCMVAVGGIGIDLVHLERDRTELQYTLDRAVLAAADLDQPLAPEAVVLDYMSKSGLGGYNVTIPDPIVSVTQKRVTASVDAEFDPLWMKFANYDEALPLKASATAEESIGNVEISLVLDVSGSMRNNSRLVNLKTAAKEFVQTMKDNTEEDKMSISIVPYSTQVSMPAEFFDHLTLSADHDYSYCLNFDSDDFNTTALSQVDEYERTMHFSIWGSRDYRRSSSYVNQATCASHQDNPERTALLFEDNVDTLQNYIDAFEDSENTSLDIGMKWGVALLDPSVQPIISAMATGEGATIANRFANRPVAHTDSETIKVVVLMTDGENTAQYYVTEDHRQGGSGVWYNQQEQVYSTYSSDAPNASKPYYWHDVYNNQGAWAEHPFGAGNTSVYFCARYYDGRCTSYYEVQEDGESVELDYLDLFADTSLQYIFYYLFNDYMNYYDARDEWYYDVYDYESPNTKDTRTTAICDAAKDAGIIVFTIGFEAPSGGQQVLRECASSDAHFYDVEGLEISDAFASIASAIRQLRLTE